MRTITIILGLILAANVAVIATDSARVAIPRARPRTETAFDKPDAGYKDKTAFPDKKLPERSSRQWMVTGVVVLAIGVGFFAHGWQYKKKTS